VTRRFQIDLVGADREAAHGQEPVRRLEGGAVDAPPGAAVVASLAVASGFAAFGIGKAVPLLAVSAVLSVVSQAGEAP